MSDTPRTDAAVHPMNLRTFHAPNSICSADFARTLERELAASIDDSKGAKDAFERLYTVANERIDTLTKDLDEARERSKSK